LAHADHPELSMFAEDPFITPPIGAGSVLYDDTMRACAEGGFQPFISQQITDPYMGMMLVAAGGGVAYLADGVTPVVPPGTPFVSLGVDPVCMNHGLACTKRGVSLAPDQFVE